MTVEGTAAAEEMGPVVMAATGELAAGVLVEAAATGTLEEIMVTVLPVGISEVEMTVERAGQLVTSAAQLVMVTSAVL